MRVGFEEALSRLGGAGGERYANVIDYGTLTVEVYAPRGTDLQMPHTRDEVYIVLSGSGWFVNGPERHRFGPGDAILVPANVTHRFEEFTDDLAVWAVFCSPQNEKAR